MPAISIDDINALADQERQQSQVPPSQNGMPDNGPQILDFINQEAARQRDEQQRKPVERTWAGEALAGLGRGALSNLSGFGGLGDMAGAGEGNAAFWNQLKPQPSDSVQKMSTGEALLSPKAWAGKAGEIAGFVAPMALGGGLAEAPGAAMAVAGNAAFMVPQMAGESYGDSLAQNQQAGVPLEQAQRRANAAALAGAAAGGLFSMPVSHALGGILGRGAEEALGNPIMAAGKQMLKGSAEMAGMSAVAEIPHMAAETYSGDDTNQMPALERFGRAALGGLQMGAILNAPAALGAGARAWRSRYEKVAPAMQDTTAPPIQPAQPTTADVPPVSEPQPAVTVPPGSESNAQAKAEADATAQGQASGWNTNFTSPLDAAGQQAHAASLQAEGALSDAQAAVTKAQYDMRAAQTAGERLGARARFMKANRDLAALKTQPATQTAPLADQPTSQEAPNASQVRGDQGQVPDAGIQPPDGGNAGGADLQRAAQAGPDANGAAVRSAGEEAGQVAPQPLPRLEPRGDESPIPETQRPVVSDFHQAVQDAAPALQSPDVESARQRVLASNDPNAKEQIAVLGGKKIMLVDGMALERDRHMDFTEGDNHQHDQKANNGVMGVPKDEIWIDANMEPRKYPDTLVHELVEENLMAKGESYDAAHPKANLAEREYLEAKNPPADAAPPQEAPATAPETAPAPPASPENAKGIPEQGVKVAAQEGPAKQPETAPVKEIKPSEFRSGLLKVGDRRVRFQPSLEFGDWASDLLTNRSGRVVARPGKPHAHMIFDLGHPQDGQSFRAVSNRLEGQMAGSLPHFEDQNARDAFFRHIIQWAMTGQGDKPEAIRHMEGSLKMGESQPEPGKADPIEQLASDVKHAMDNHGTLQTQEEVDMAAHLAGGGHAQKVKAGDLATGDELTMMPGHKHTVKEVNGSKVRLENDVNMTVNKNTSIPIHDFNSAEDKAERAAIQAEGEGGGDLGTFGEEPPAREKTAYEKAAEATAAKARSGDLFGGELAAPVIPPDTSQGELGLGVERKRLYAKDDVVQMRDGSVRPLDNDVHEGDPVAKQIVSKVGATEDMFGPRAAAKIGWIGPDKDHLQRLLIEPKQREDGKWELVNRYGDPDGNTLSTAFDTREAALAAKPDVLRELAGDGLLHTSEQAERPITDEQLAALKKTHGNIERGDTGPLTKEMAMRYEDGHPAKEAARDLPDGAEVPGFQAAAIIEPDGRITLSSTATPEDAMHEIAHRAKDLVDSGRVRLSPAERAAAETHFGKKWGEINGETFATEVAKTWQDAQGRAPKSLFERAVQKIGGWMKRFAETMGLRGPSFDDVVDRIASGEVAGRDTGEAQAAGAPEMADGTRASITRAPFLDTEKYQDLTSEADQMVNDRVTADKAIEEAEREFNTYRQRDLGDKAGRRVDTLHDMEQPGVMAAKRNIKAGARAGAEAGFDKGAELTSEKGIYLGRLEQSATSADIMGRLKEALPPEIFAKMAAKVPNAFTPKQRGRLIDMANNAVADYNQRQSYKQVAGMAHTVTQNVQDMPDKLKSYIKGLMVGSKDWTLDKFRNTIIPQMDRLLNGNEEIAKGRDQEATDIAKELNVDPVMDHWRAEYERLLGGESGSRMTRYLSPDQNDAIYHLMRAYAHAVNEYRTIEINGKRELASDILPQIAKEIETNGKPQDRGPVSQAAQADRERLAKLLDNAQTPEERDAIQKRLDAIHAGSPLPGAHTDVYQNRFWRVLTTGLMAPKTFFQRLAGEHSMLDQVGRKAMDSGDNIYRNTRDAAMNPAREFVKGLTSNINDWSSPEKSLRTIKLFGGREFAATKAEMVDLINTIGDPETKSELLLKGAKGIVFARDKTMRPIKMDGNDLQSILDQAQPDERAAAGKLMEIANGDLSDVADKAWMKRYGIPLTRQDGAYWPRMRRLDRLSATDAYWTQMQMERSLDNQSQFKGRVTNTNAIVIGDAFSKFNRHVEGTAAMVGREGAARSFFRVIQDPSIKQALTGSRKYGLQDQTDMLKYVKDRRGLDMRMDDGFNAGARSLIRNITTGTLFLKPQVMMMHALSYMNQFASDIPYKHVLSAGLALRDRLGKAMQGHPLDALVDPAIRQEIIDNPHAAFLRDRLNATSPQLLSATDSPNIVSKAFGAPSQDGYLSGIASKALGFSDQIPVQMAWRAAKAWGMEKGLTGDALAKFTADQAEEAVRTTNTVYDAGSLPQLSRDAQRNPALKLLTMFNSAPIQTLNIMARAYDKFQSSPKAAGDISEFAFKALALPVTSAAIAVALRASVRGAYGAAAGTAADERDQLQTMLDNAKTPGERDSIQARLDKIGSIPDDVKRQISQTAQRVFGMYPLAGPVLNDAINFSKAAIYNERKPEIQSFGPLGTIMQDAVSAVYDGASAAREAGTGSLEMSGQRAGESKANVTGWRAADEGLRSMSMLMGLPIGGAEQALRGFIPSAQVPTGAAREANLARLEAFREQQNQTKREATANFKEESPDLYAQMQERRRQARALARGRE